jgi:hypothetical protein
MESEWPCPRAPRRTTMVDEGIPKEGPIKPTRQRLLVGLELFTGAAAAVGGLLLAIRPDGSLLKADPSALAGSPFTTWRMPGILLMTLVGGGFLVSGAWQWRRGWHAAELSAIAGIGLVAFEGVEVAWIGFQPLQAVFAVVGLAVAGLAWRRSALRGRSGRPARVGSGPDQPRISPRP